MPFPVFRFPLFLLLIALVGLCFDPAQANKERANILRSFSDFRQAMIGMQGRSAAEVLTRDSLGLFQFYRTMALQGSPTEINELPAYDRFQVFRFRHRMTPSQLKGMSGADLFTFLVDNDWIDRKRFGILEARNPEMLGGGVAEAQCLEAGVLTNKRLFFRMEGGVWKFNLRQFLKADAPLFENEVRLSGQEPNDYLFTLINQEALSPVREDIWEPMIAPAVPDPERTFTAEEVAAAIKAAEEEAKKKAIKELEKREIEIR